LAIARQPDQRARDEQQEYVVVSFYGSSRVMIPAMGVIGWVILVLIVIVVASVAFVIIRRRRRSGRVIAVKEKR
jgi:apolipoprotein N-acyltransferase